VCCRTDGLYFKTERGFVTVFFADDNFAISIKRTKSLLRDIIEAGPQLPWTAQISANLLRDEERVDLIARSGGKIIFIGMESIDPVNLADVGTLIHMGRFCQTYLQKSSANRPDFEDDR
jgi:radical SAM superfamily enzyme YgiQ (UPF0313 family)